MPTKITTLTVNELGQASASRASADAAAASADAAAASAAAALAAENSLLEWKGPWVTATAYAPSDLVEENGNTYVCVSAHTSGTFSTDLGNSLWELFAAKGDTGPGSGDLLAANNLSDVASIPTARANLGISTFGATLIDDVDAAAARTTLGLDAASTQAYEEFSSTSAVTNRLLKLNTSGGSAIPLTTVDVHWRRIGSVWIVRGDLRNTDAYTTSSTELLGVELEFPPNFTKANMGSTTGNTLVGNASISNLSGAVSGMALTTKSYGCVLQSSNVAQFNANVEDFLFQIAESNSISMLGLSRVSFTCTFIDDGTA